MELTSSKNGDTTDIFASFYGDKYCTEDNCISHVNVSKAFDFCSKAVESVNGGENFGYNIWWWDN